MRASFRHDRQIGALGDLVMGLYADASRGGGRGVLDLKSAELSVMMFAVLVSESDGRPMSPGKLSHFAGMPRSTLGRKLRELQEAGFLARGEDAVRLDPVFLRSERLRTALVTTGSAIVRCASAIEQDLIQSHAAWIVPALKRVACPLRHWGVMGGLALDLARMSYAGPGPWFGARARNWLLRWSIVRAEARDHAATPAGIAVETGMSRAAVYRQLDALALAGELIQDETGVFLGGATTYEPYPANADRMVSRVFRAFHRLSEMDALASRT